MFGLPTRPDWRLGQAILCVAALFVGQLSGGQSPVYFRCRGGLAADDSAVLPDRLDGPGNLEWRRPLLPGHSTPCVVGHRVFVTAYQGQKLLTMALERGSGQVLWQRPAPAKTIEPYHRISCPATATPACDGQRLFVFFGSHGMLCYDCEDGRLLWSRPLGPFQDEYGAASSPILADGLVIINEDHDTGGYLLALDRQTGRTVWKTPRPEATRSYSTPVIWPGGSGGTGPQVVVAGSLRLTGYDLRTGRRLWWVDGLARIVVPTPAQDGQVLYVASWSPGGDAGGRISMDPWPVAAQRWDADRDGKITRQELPTGPVLLRFFRIDLDQDGGLDRKEWEKQARLFDLAKNGLMAVRPGKSGNITATSVLWTHRKGIPYVPSPLVYRGVIYLVKNGGIVTSLDRNGRVLKQARIPATGSYYASPVAGGGKVYLASETGVVTVLRAAGQWQVISSHDFGERIMATPVIADGRLYVRTERALYSFRPARQGS